MYFGKITSYPKILIEFNFGVIFGVALLLIIKSSTIITREFNYGTIKNTLYHNSFLYIFRSQLYFL